MPSGTVSERKRDLALASQTECLLTKKQTARYLGISISSLERLADLPRIKLNGAVRFVFVDVVRFVAAHRQRADGDGVAP